MTLFLGVLVAAVLIGYLVGGRLRGFEPLRVRWWVLAPLGLAMQALPLPNGRHGTDLWIRVAVLGVSYVLLLVFAARNFRISGVPIVFVGLALNMAVITVNGGMPVSREALRASGQGDLLRVLTRDEGAKHHLMTPDDHLTPIGDVIPVAGPIKQVVSVGDLFVYLGLAWVIVAIMRRRTPDAADEPDRESYRGKHRRESHRPHPDHLPPPAATTSET
jgi:hypothetical protein